jgi:two-component system chemotaxis sensor kinase CheA
LLTLQVEPREPWPALAELDPFACNLRLRALCVADRAELARIFRLVPDQVRILAVPTAAVRAHRKEPPADRDMINLVRSVLEEQSRVLRISSSSDDFVGRVGAAARAAAHALRHAMRIDAAESVERAGAATLARNDVTSLISALEQALAVLGELPAPDGELGPAPEAAVAPLADGERQVVRSLRVHEAKIDGLVNLAGELLVAKNALAHLAKMIESELPGHALAGAAKREHEAIERLAGEMHAAVLQLRMVPVAQVLRAFPRLVRDLSHRLDKKVELVTRGETTEADKTIVDRLHEPLLHLVRNALDHGIESPAQRRASDKRDTATITIEAARLGDRFVVDVIDDGCGIDPAIVRRTAQERRLMAENELALLSDEQVLDLIFAAGFSTAAAVSDISGRGVGMDAVRATIEQLGGRVSVISRVGAGTTVRLDLPMSIAMSRIMVVQAGGQLFGIPMDAVTETVRLRPDRISQIKSNDGFVLRDRVMPICSLAELMKLPRTATSAADERLLVVAETAGRIAALEVAAIRDRLDIVLKPMQGLLAGVRGFAGTTVLGDGSVLLVLDLKEILP